MQLHCHVLCPFRSLLPCLRLPHFYPDPTQAHRERRATPDAVRGRASREVDKVLLNKRSRVSRKGVEERYVGGEVVAGGWEVFRAEDREMGLGGGVKEECEDERLGWIEVIPRYGHWLECGLRHAGWLK